MLLTLNERNVNHAKIMRILIEAGADLNNNNEFQQTSLMFTAINEKQDLMIILLEAGAAVNICDNHGFTALGYALLTDHKGCVKELIHAGAEVKVDEDTMVSPMKIAALCGGVECLKEPPAAGDQQDHETALIFASVFGNTDCLKQLIVTGTDVNAVSLISTIKTAKVESVKILLKSGADMNATDEFGNTALMTAIEVGSKTIFKLLINHGAKVNAENCKGETVLYLAVKQSHLEYERIQSNDQNKRKYILNEELSFEGLSLMVYILLQKGAHLHDTKSGLNPCTMHLTSAKYKNPNPTVLKLLDAAGSKEKIKELSSLSLLQGCAQNFIREHLKQAHPERNLYFTVPQLGLPQLLQSSLLFNAVQRYNLVPNIEEKKLLQKIKEGDTENIQHFINARVDVNVQDENDMTPLMIASQDGHTELVKLLIKSRADVNHQNSSGDTALIYALKYPESKNLLKYLKDIKHVEKIQACVQVLLQHDAKVNIQGKDGDTALMHLARNTPDSWKSYQNTNIWVKYFTGNFKKMHANMEQCMFTLIDAGADPNLKNDEGRTALILGSSNLNFIQKMIESGADVNWMDKDGNTALTQAAGSGAVDCMETLIEAGADVNDGNPTPPMAAAMKGHVVCLKILVREGADLDKRGENGRTALMATTFGGHVECVKLLIQAGADLDIRDENGYTALMAAAFEGHVECVKLLVQEGADLDIRDEDGDTALMLAAKNKSGTCLNTLLKAGAEVDYSVIGAVLDTKDIKPPLNSKDAQGN